MNGMWKLAAMSVVIGAGLVVVWQAQQGLTSTMPTAGVLNRSDVDTVEPAAPEVQLGFADPAALGLPAEQHDSEVAASKETVAVAASVPPEPTAAATATNEALPKPSEAARYRRGLNFRATPGDDGRTTPPDVSAERRTPEVTASAPKEAFDFGPTLVDPATAAKEPVIVPVAAKEPFEVDPFFNADPPADKQIDSTAPRLPELNDVPLPGEPSPAPIPTLGDPALEPLPAGEPPAELPGDPRRQTPPAELKEVDPFEQDAPKAVDPFEKNAPKAADPFEKNEPKAADPFEKDDPFAAEPPPSRLPTELDAPPTATPPVTPPERVPAPAEEDPFDPFGPAKVPTPTAPARPPVESLPSLDGPPDRMEAESRSLTPRQPTPSDRDPAADLMLGDGTAPLEVPRGIQEPRLTIEKIAPPKALLGQVLIYSILVRNIGTTPATQVTIEDRIPRGTRLIGTAPRAEMQDKKLTWKIGTLQPNDERKISIKVIPEEEGSLGSVAKVSFVTEVATDIVVGSPQLRLRVNGPSEMRMQESTEFVFTLSNPGDTEAKNVTLRSIIPEGLSHPAGSDLEYKIERLAPGESREVRLELTGTRVGRTTLQSIAMAEGNVSTETKTNVEVIGEQIVLTRSSPPRVYVGRQAVFSNKVGNEGQRPVQRVRVTETVPAGFEFITASDGGIFDSSTRTITWNLGPLAIGGEQRVSATLNPKSAGQFEGVVTATGPTGSVATVKPKVSIEGFPALALEPLGLQRLVAVGEKVTSRVQIKNNGSAAADNVRLSVTLPPEMKLVSVKAPAAYQVIGQRLEFEALPALSPKTGATFELALEAIAPGDCRLEMQFAADHLRSPVKHEEAVNVFSEK